MNEFFTIFGAGFVLTIFLFAWTYYKVTHDENLKIYAKTHSDEMLRRFYLRAVR